MLSQTMIYYLILFFSSVLVYFLIVLIRTHIKSATRESRRLRIKQMLDDVIIAYQTKNRNTLDRYRKMRTPLGIDVLDETLQEYADAQDPTLREIINGSSYRKYIASLMRSKDQQTKIFTIKLIGNLRLYEYKNIIFKLLYQGKSNIDLQYNCIMTLSLLGDENSLTKIFYDENFNHLLTFRSLQEILKSYTGDKSRLYWILLSASDKYIQRICIKRIGAEKITRLAGFIMPYLSDPDFNVVIDAIRSLGQLKYKEAIPKIESLLSHPRWEVRSICVTALADIDLNAEIRFVTNGLYDKEWWVRRNAAAAAVRYEPLGEVVREVLASGDQFAKEILAASIRKKELIGGGANK